MKRIDLHIHTASVKEEQFEFNPDLLFEHVKEQKLDAIAITNHNLLDMQNFQAVKDLLEPLNCTVFPGIELDALSTHILLITDESQAEDLANCCKSLKNPPNTVSELLSAFPMIGSSLVIPHYDKDPSISDETMGQMEDYIDAVEASSLKKAIRLSKTRKTPFPVVAFTDFRFGGHGQPGPQSVYVDTDSLTIANIKAAFKANRGVRYNIEGTDQLEIAPGVIASDSLNLLIGRRSTGKTVTLDRIKSMCDEGDVYYIKQGSLVADSTEVEFSSYIEGRYSSQIADYYKRWIPILKQAKAIGDASTRRSSISAYLNALKKYADSSTLADAYSDCHLFKAQPIAKPDCAEDEMVIKAVLTLLDADETKELIEQHISNDALVALLSNIVSFAKKRQLANAAIERTNAITSAIKMKLTVQSSQDEYPVPILSNAFKDHAFINRCIKLLESCWQKREVLNDNGSLTEKYIVYATRLPYEKTDDLKKKSGLSESLGRITGKSAEKFFDAIIGLGKCDEHPAALFDLCIKVRDGKGADLSGGQRTEFIFMDRLNEAERYPIVLIDEPESSFDNIFLDEHIAEMIRRLATHATVFVSSHNQVLSFALKPKKVFYTHYDAAAKEYSIYGGELVDDQIINQCGDAKPTRESIFRMLEANEESYRQRKAFYEGA